MIEFISYQQFPDDPYCKEIVTIQIDGKYRVAYVAKQGKTGTKFWDVMSAGVMQNGAKVFHKAFQFDSNFQQEEIKKLLASKPWEKSQSVFNQHQPSYQNDRHNDSPKYQQPELFDAGECPF